MALTGGSIVLHNVDSGTLSIFDNTGAPTATLPMSMTASSFVPEAGQWTGVLTQTGAFAQVSTTEVEAPLFSFIAGTGNAQRQAQPHWSGFGYFLPVATLVRQPFRPYYASDYMYDTKVLLQGTHPSYSIGSEASRKRFLEQASLYYKAYVVIAHALLDPDPSRPSAGIRTTDGVVVMPRSPQPVDPSDTGKPEAQWTRTTVVPALPSKSRIVFIASCKVGPEFEAWWNIDANVDRYLIAPDLDKGDQIDLYWGAQTWLNIALKLADVTVSLKEAVDYANGRLPRDQNNVPINTYRVYGHNGGVGVYIK
jgi:hypothetical protein